MEAGVLPTKTLGQKGLHVQQPHRVVPGINHPFAFLSLLNYHVCFFLKKIYICIYFWLLWVFVAVSGPSRVAMSRGCCLAVVCRLLTAAASLVHCSSGSGVHGLNSGGSWAYLPCSLWDLFRPGIEPVSTALAERFLTTRQPGNFSPHPPPFSLIPLNLEEHRILSLFLQAAAQGISLFHTFSSTWLPALKRGKGASR